MSDPLAVKPQSIKRAYDYVVIGSGASGAIVAGELSKTGAEVLVVEAGGEDAGPTVTNPSIWFYNVGGPFDWALPIEPVPQLNNRRFNMALGRVLGGGSSVNAMVWTRGSARDYDAWARHGAAGRAFKDVLPTFKAQEDWEGGANEWRGVGGPVHLRKPIDPHPTAPAFLEAARQMGFAIIDDMNGPVRPGAGYINMNIGRDGVRASSARTFLLPNLNRSNLTLLLNTHATRILFEGDRARGVEIFGGDVTQTVEATREVMLAAGTIHSAKLLMLSGVGDAAELRKLGITPAINLPGVGKNLQDHILVSGVVYSYSGKVVDRPANSDGVEAEVYLSSGVDDNPIDIALILEQFPVATPEAAARFAAPPKEGFTIAPALVQPTSRGQVRLASADWRDAPVIQANYLGTDHDIDALVKAVEAARDLSRQSAFDPLREAEIVPGPRAISRQDMIDFIRTASASFGHAVGTAKIGTDAGAVVDSRLRVQGVRGLRVADASVMPSIISGPGTNAPSYMIGGRAAEFIKADI
jgi:choline dehydrogenase